MGKRGRSHYLAHIAVAGILILCASYATRWITNPSGDETNVQEKSMGSETGRNSRESFVSGADGKPLINGVPVQGPPMFQQKPAPCASPPADSKIMEDELRRAARIFGIDLGVGFKSDHEKRRPPYGDPIREINTADRKRLAFELASGRLLTFLDLSVVDAPVVLGKEKLIGKDRAMETARDVLTELNVDATLEADEMKFRNTDQQAPEDVSQAEWVATGMLNYEGIPYFGSGVRVSISAVSGRVSSYSYRPVGPPPASTEERIDANQAADAVKTFWATRFPSAPDLDFRGVPKRVITLPNNCWTRGDGQPLAPAETSRLCWLVYTVPSVSGYLTILYVDAQTGEICGGMG